MRRAAVEPLRTTTSQTATTTTCGFEHAGRIARLGIGTREFIHLLKGIDTETRADLHLLVDNYATHKHPQVNSSSNVIRASTSSWLNLVERWLREVTQQRTRRGSFRAVQELARAIKHYIENHNRNLRVFVWSAPVDRI